MYTAILKLLEIFAYPCEVIDVVLIIVRTCNRTDLWSDVMVSIVPGVGVGVLAGANVNVLAPVMTVLKFIVPLEQSMLFCC